MKSLASALVYAVTYINIRDEDNEDRLDQDVGALESIAGMLAAATEAEKDALAQAADEALAEEKAGSNRAHFVRDYGAWMEEMFGDEWTGNTRKSGQKSAKRRATRRS